MRIDLLFIMQSRALFFQLANVILTTFLAHTFWDQVKAKCELS